MGLQASLFSFCMYEKTVLREMHWGKSQALVWLVCTTGRVLIDYFGLHGFLIDYHHENA